MVPLSRRRVLQFAGGAAAAVAGCNGARPNDEATPTAGVQPTVDYESLTVRAKNERPFVSYRTGTEESNGDPAPDDQSYTEALLTTAADAERVAFGRSVDGADDARAFLADTDFQRDVVFLHEQPVSDCRELAVNYVATTADSFDIEFCTPLRPASVDCSVDRRDVVVALVRFPLRADAVSSYSVGGGRDCRRPPRRERG